MKKICYVILSCFFISCNPVEKKQENIIIKKGDAFYKQSEMAALMLLMYEKNAENKKIILEGKQPKEFPKEFLKIHTAKLTDSTDRKIEFKAYSDFYIENLKKVFEPSKESLKTKHNNVINSCVTCHQTTCIGPIQKIKKLLIR